MQKTDEWASRHQYLLCSRYGYRDGSERKWASPFDGSQEFPAKLYQFPSRSAHWVRIGAPAVWGTLYLLFAAT